MKALLLYGDDPNYLFILLAFIFAVFVTRWIFCIDKIVDSLQQQNEHALTQVRLLKKMLLNQGNTHEEIDNIIEHGNKKPKE